MMGGYLAQIVESGMTSLRQVRGPIRTAPAQRDVDEQHTVESTEPAGAFPAPDTDAHVEFPLDPSARLPPQVTLAPGDDRSADAPATDVQPLAPPTLDVAPAEVWLPEVHIEERPPHTHRAASGIRPETRGTGAQAPSLKDAGIRNVLLRDEAPGETSANRQGPVGLDATVRTVDRPVGDGGANDQRATSPLDRTRTARGERPLSHPGVPAARVEQWQRLKDRLLMEHYPGPSKSNVAVAADERHTSQPMNQRSGGTAREIVIEQLEVVVAAPQPAPLSPAPPSSAPHSRPPRSGAWSVATRRYLGRL